jgi:hypothetical protein
MLESASLCLSKTGLGLVQCEEFQYFNPLTDSFIHTNFIAIRCVSLIATEYGKSAISEENKTQYSEVS